MVMWVLGHFTHGQMGHGSQNVTYSQLSGTTKVIGKNS